MNRLTSRYKQSYEDRFLIDSEWFGTDKLGDIELLASLTNDKNSDIYFHNPYGVGDMLLSTILSTTLIGDTKDFEISEEKTRLKNALSSKESTIILDRIVEYKQELDEELEEIEKSGILGLNIDTFMRLLDSNIHSDAYIFNNAYAEGNLDLSKSNIIESLTENITKTAEDKTRPTQSSKPFHSISLEGGSLYSPNKVLAEFIKNNRSSINTSIGSSLGWRDINLAHHALGSAENIAELFGKILTVQNVGGATRLKGRTEIGCTFLFDIFHSYIDDVTIRNEFDKEFEITVDYTYLRVLIINSDTSTNDPKIKSFKLTSLIGPAVPNVLQSTNSLYTAINDAHTAINTNDIKKIFGKESLIIIFYVINGLLIKAIESAINSFKKFMNTYITYSKKSDHFNFIIENMFATVKDLDELLKNRLVEYFGLTNAKAIYAIESTDESTLTPKISLNNSILRIIGYKDLINDIANVSKDKYPIALDSGIIDQVKTKKLYTEFLLGKEKSTVDRYTKKIISIGGIIQQEKIARITLISIKKYFSITSGNKQAAIKYIEHILTKMRSSLRREDVIEMKLFIENLYLKLAETKPDYKDSMAESAIEEIGNIYKIYKEEEYKKLIELYELTIHLDAKKDLIMKSVSASNKAVIIKEKILVQMSYYQLKAISFKIMALELYKYFEKWYSSVRGGIIKATAELPEKYYNLLLKQFSETDQELLKKINQSELSSKISSIPVGKILDYHLMYNKSSVDDKKDLGFLTKLKTFFSIKDKNKTDDYVISKHKSNNLANNSNKLTNRLKSLTDKSKHDSNSISSSLTPSNIHIDRSTTAFNQSQKDDSFPRERELTGVESGEFWRIILEKLGGRTIFIPVVSEHTIRSNTHGIVDILQIAIDGKYNKKFFKSGGNIDLRKLSTVYNDIGLIMVTEKQSKIDDISSWRCIRYGEITEAFEKLAAPALRRHIYGLLASEATYMRRTNYKWPNESSTKGTIIMYCKQIASLYSRCPILASREGIAAHLGSIMHYT